ncbi:hypothetical protein [Aureimonas glaciei]|uniref:Uncharacterized protein n=1 Tax=Aureimonas glaciei TaxID=1776957 RepID=A0A916YG28_9HYPH|nr:hypothetical protein [Aureimonas glaciei]GGD43132.1 hypothetical protein GCM10011335_52250 [Aureimonas glaciei]
MSKLRLTDLLIDGLRMMIRLDDGMPHGDSVGLPADEVRPHEVALLKRLMELRLAEKVVGWQDQTTYRLTERGRKLRDDGQVSGAEGDADD